MAKIAKMSTGIYTMEGIGDVAILVVPIDHASERVTAKGNTTLGNIREDIQLEGNTHVMQGLCYRYK